ncbi:MAG TPA: peptide chain release factor N(5)-glutamine methyltransferase [Pyrinomonadaceae bacterium]|nr:peptide chain release factor N(5)-glutamine methyltransferase [Pyrinomonadaceae bacterium]
MTISIAEALLEASNVLRRASVPEARREAGWLLMHALDCDRTYLIAHADAEITDAQFEIYKKLVEARSTGQPLQYITGHQDFFGFDFEVSRDVLIPRPETEILVETALSLVSQIQLPFICDVGTGSGCIVVALLKSLPQARAIALDISEAAIEIAARNAQQHGVDNRIQFTVSDCFAAIQQLTGPTFDLIVSNPPYVAEHAVEGLQREVRDFEPRVALTAGPDGLAVITRVIDDASRFLKPDGFLVLEIGYDQHDAVRNLVDPAIWQLLDIHQDLQGIPRIFALSKRS